MVIGLTSYENKPIMQSLGGVNELSRDLLQLQL